MKKIETVWCQLLYQTLEQRQVRFKQQDLAGKLGMSLSTINHALKDLRQMGAVEVNGRGGQVVDAEKVLMHWANKRSLHEDIVSSLMLSGGVAEMEGLLPPGSVLGGYSAVRAWFGEAPADYSSVWVYHRQPEAVKERLAGEKPGQTKVMVLQLNPSIPLRGETTTLAHTFVDLWNMSEWMAKQFTGRVKEEIDGILS